jgi:hypothetical protein
MFTHSRMFQRTGALGIVYALLFAAANFLIGNGPSTSASGASVVKYYHSHRVTETAGVFVVAVSLVAFAFFLSSLRRSLGRTIEGRQLTSIVTVGGAIYATGILVMCILTMALVDAGHYAMGGAAQTLNVLSSDAWVPVVVGISILALGTGVAAIRTGGLPGWLSWASIVLGVLAIAGPLGAIAFLVMPVWGLATGIVLFRSAVPEERTDLASAVVPASMSNV